MSGATPTPPSAPNKWPPRTITDRETIIKLKSELITQKQELRLQICSVTNLEAAVNELEENAVIANRRINSLHSELTLKKQENMDLRRINSDFALTKAKTDHDPTHLSVTQANIQACQAKHMALFIQKEAARLIAVNKHDFDLVRKGHTLEISRLKEEIKDLTLKAQPNSTQPLTPTWQKTYGEKIRGLNAHIEDLKKKTISSSLGQQTT